MHVPGTRIVVRFPSVDATGVASARRFVVAPGYETVLEGRYGEVLGKAATNVQDA